MPKKVEVISKVVEKKVNKDIDKVEEIVNSNVIQDPNLTLAKEE